MIHAVVCTDIEKWFGAGDTRIQVLRGLSLEIPLGEMAMIEGPSGCGKTTLISIMAGLLDASGGGLEVLDDRVRLRLANEPREPLCIHVVVRETEEEAWTAAGALIANIPENFQDMMDKITSKTDSEGEKRQPRAEGKRGTETIRELAGEDDPHEIREEERAEHPAVERYSTEILRDERHDRRDRKRFKRDERHVENEAHREPAPSLMQ